MDPLRLYQRTATPETSGLKIEAAPKPASLSADKARFFVSPLPSRKEATLRTKKIDLKKNTVKRFVPVGAGHD
jgi:hypothetical protein